MKNEQKAFGDRLRERLAEAGFDTSPVVLMKSLGRHGKLSVTQQTISGWLGGRHMPRVEALRALANMTKTDPCALLFGEKAVSEVREPRVAWPDRVKARDQLLFEEFLTLPDEQRELVRELVGMLAAATSKTKQR